MSNSESSKKLPKQAGNKAKAPEILGLPSKPASLPKPEPTSPEEQQAIEEAVDDWFKAAEEPTETKT